MWERLPILRCAVRMVSKNVTILGLLAHTAKYPENAFHKSNCPYGLIPRTILVKNVLKSKSANMCKVVEFHYIESIFFVLFRPSEESMKHTQTIHATHLFLHQQSKLSTNLLVDETLITSHSSPSPSLCTP